MWCWSMGVFLCVCVVDVVGLWVVFCLCWYIYTGVALCFVIRDSFKKYVYDSECVLTHAAFIGHFSFNSCMFTSDSSTTYE